MSRLLGDNASPVGGNVGSPQAGDPRAVLKLLQCALQLRAGNPAGCLDLLVEVIGQMGGSQAELAQLESIAFDDAYIWDRCLPEDDPCRPSP